MNSARRYLSAILLGVLTSLGALSAPGQDRTNAQLPLAKSPVDAFRDLLALDSTAVPAALSNRNEQARERLAKKISEYKAMDADERELRLLATELRWYVSQLMQLPATNRANRLAEIRGELRPLVESRLARWDALPEELRAQFIQNEEALSLLLRSGSASRRLQQQLVAEVSPALRDTLHRALARLDAMSPAERQHAFDVFENVFTMTPVEKEKALQVMSGAEKQQMEQTLAAFNRLPDAQRKICVRSYEKFAAMSHVQRALFLRNVQIWERMSPAEREKWRELVRNVELLPPVRELATPPPVLHYLKSRIATNRT